MCIDFKKSEIAYMLLLFGSIVSCIVMIEGLLIAHIMFMF